ncbi:HAMP domain-containing histidine kinase [Candidatus Obscuribacterales bacterium]|nr:HAMP domain-containing histidine kinase [Candidatus Obscuribacterales bacterium]MBX3152825.1 HAMP domain-containing histidine kinase [Candidatus Obscuribacterales bacterium]
MGSLITNNIDANKAGATGSLVGDSQAARKSAKILPVHSKSAIKLSRVARQKQVDETILPARIDDTFLTFEPEQPQSFAPSGETELVGFPTFDSPGTSAASGQDPNVDDNVHIVGDWVLNSIPCLIRGIEEDAPVLSIRYPRGAKRRYFTHHSNQLTKVETVLGDEDKEKTRVVYTKDLTSGAWYMTLDGITSRLPGEISLSDNGVFHVQVDNTGRCRREYPDGTISVDMACSAHHKGAHALVQALMSEDDGSGGVNNRTVLDLLSVVSHDLRSPLTSVQGLLTLLSAGAFGAIPDKARERIASVESDLTRLTRLINELLDAEMLVSGKLVMRRQLLDVQDLFDAAVGSLSGLALQQKVQLSVIKSNLQLFADKDRLVRVLVNIVANAIKYSPKGATVVLSAEFNGDSVILKVKDSGRGIATKYQKAIFERFQQVSEGDWSDKGGVGLGLAISKSIVEAHGGTIGVESQKGAGSTFWVSLPANTLTEYS